MVPVSDADKTVFPGNVKSHFLKLKMTYTEINKRYSELAESACCLSCGDTINYSEAKTGEVCVDLGSGRGTDVLRLTE